VNIAPTHFLFIFKTLLSTEQKAFVRFLEAFYYKEKIAIRTLKYMMEQDPNLVDEELLFKHSFGRDFIDSKKDKKSIHNNFNDLKKYLLEFLTWQELKKKPDANFSLLDYFREKGLLPLYKQQLDNLGKRIQLVSKPTLLDFQTKLNYDHYVYYNSPVEHLTEAKPGLKTLFESNDLHYFARKLKYACELISRGAIVKEKTYNLDIDLLLKEIDQPLYSDQPLIQFYLKVLYLVHKDDIDAYNYLKVFLEKEDQIGVAEFEALIMYLLNFTARRIRLNQEGFQGEYFKICKIADARQIFTAHGYFPVETFLNIINIASNLGETDWALVFLAKNINSIEPKFKNDISSFCLARILYEKKEFERANSLIQSVQITDFNLSLQCRILTIRCLCEQGIHKGVILSALENLQQYSYRNGIMSESLSITTRNFVKILNRFFKSSELPDKILAELEMTSPIWAKDWIKKYIERFI
jgi:hypothetical protein